MEIATERKIIPGGNGFDLEARLDRPAEGKPRAYAIYAHCFTCTKDIHVAYRICTQLASRGYGVLRFDFTGLGGSGGEFADTTFSSNVNDLEAVAEYLKQIDMPAQLMIGHSLGGAAALVATCNLEEIKAVVTLNAPCHPAHVAHHFEQVKDEILWTGEADVSIVGRNFRIQRQFFEDLETFNMDKIISNLNAALLVMHSPQDSTVNIKNASYIFSLAKHPKSFISLDHVDHLISKAPDAQYIADVIDVWLKKYIDF